MAKDVLKHFMASNFDSEDSFRFYLRGSYSQSSLEILHRKLNQLTKEAGELHREDSNLGLIRSPTSRVTDTTSPSAST